VELAIVVEAQIIRPYPKPSGVQKFDVKVEIKAAWTNFALIFVVARGHLQLKFIILDGFAPIFGMELSECFELL
jgi:hypothetical protein